MSFLFKSWGVTKTQKEIWKDQIEREQNLINQEIETYKIKHQAESAQTLASHEQQIIDSRKNVIDIQQLSAVQTAEAEHEFHKNQEEKGIKLALLDAQIDAKSKLLDLMQGDYGDFKKNFERAVTAEADSKSKGQVIETLTKSLAEANEMIKFLATKIPEVNLDKFTIDLKTTVTSPEVKVDCKK